MKLSIKLAAALALLTIATGVWAQQKEKKVKDQVEYDLFSAATKETDPTKKLQHLTTWKEKYPDSDYRDDRLVLMIQTYQALRQGDKMLETAQELVKNDPKNITGLYYITILTASLNNTAADRLELGEKASNGLIALLPETFDASKKPANVTDDVWKKERDKMEILARKTLAFVANARKQPDKVEEELTKILKVNPNSGQVSYQLGSAILAQKKPEKQLTALYHIARAGWYEGEEALAPDVRKQVQAYFEKTYTTFHGGKDGMQEWIDNTKKSPFPQGELVLESSLARQIREEEEMKLKDPQKALWLGVKKELVGPNGPTYFEGGLKGAALPKLKGKVISVSPAGRPKEIVLALATDDTPEIKLKVETAYPNAAEPGTVLEFDGAVPQEFSADPFLLTATVEKEQVTGWPAAPKPTPKSGASKKGAAKK